MGHDDTSGHRVQRPKDPSGIKPSQCLVCQPNDTLPLCFLDLVATVSRPSPRIICNRSYPQPLSHTFRVSLTLGQIKMAKPATMATRTVLLCLVVVMGSQLLGATASRRALQQVPPPPPLPAVAGPNPNGTVLAVESLNATGASTALANETKATIFAPTDAAFEALAAQLGLASPMDLFNATYNATAANITALHVIPGVVITTANLTAGVNVTEPSLLGPVLVISPLTNGTVTVNVLGSDVVATVVTPDVPFNGSVVHVINKVLLPPANETATWGIPL